MVRRGRMANGTSAKRKDEAKQRNRKRGSRCSEEMTKQRIRELEAARRLPRVRSGCISQSVGPAGRQAGRQAGKHGGRKAEKRVERKSRKVTYAFSFSR